MRRESTGSFITSVAGGEPCLAFVPSPLPPHPPLQVDAHLQELLDRAHLALGRLDGLATLLPDPGVFLYGFVRKEAVLSSQIEGTQSSLADLLSFEAEAAPGVPMEDVQAVSSYVDALTYGLGRLQDGFPLSLRLVREFHERLLAHWRGATRAPGEWRWVQSWVGGARPGEAAFVPPPPGQVMDCLTALEGFLHDRPSRQPPLFKAALAHVQFETIHPFLDGNGRVGRMLIPLILVNEGILAEPLLYVSLHFKVHRATYYELLQRVRTHGDWEAWLGFFATAVAEAAEQAVATAKALLALQRDDRSRVQAIGRQAGSALLDVLEADLAIVRETTGRRRDRVYVYPAYLTLLSQEGPVQPR